MICELIMSINLIKQLPNNFKIKLTHKLFDTKYNYLCRQFNHSDLGIIKFTNWNNTQTCAINNFIIHCNLIDKKIISNNECLHLLKETLMVSDKYTNQKFAKYFPNIYNNIK